MAVLGLIDVADGCWTPAAGNKNVGDQFEPFLPFDRYLVTLFGISQNFHLH